MIPLPSHVYAVILAGGSGTRFWPKSRHTTPKQLCTIGHGDRTMLELTLDRLDQFIPQSRRLIVTHKDQADKTAALLGKDCPLILAEPEARNTTAALTLAALEIQHRHKDSKHAPIMISLHADAIINDTPRLHEILAQAVAVSEQGKLTLLGIKPAYPETGYGYIERGERLSPHLAGYQVKGFKEKPDYQSAVSYVKQGTLFWNSGIFVWQTQVFLEELKTFAPHILDTLVTLNKGGSKSFLDLDHEELSQAYGRLQKIAVDHAILEVSQKIAMVEADFGWQDVGSWDALAKAFAPDEEGNLCFGPSLRIDTQNTTIDSDGPLIATIGLNHMVVVAAKGAVLVCPQDRAQEVKKIVEELKSANKTEYL